MGNSEDQPGINNKTITLLQLKTFLDIVRRMVKYYIKFEAQYGVMFMKALAKDAFEKMTKDEFLADLRSPSYLR